MNIKVISIAALCMSLIACGGGGGSSSSTPPPTPSNQAIPTPVPTSGSYVHIEITPNSGTICGNGQPNPYNNAPCISVTICQSGTSNCDTVDNILVDTGSYGLRVFKSLLPNTGNSLTPMMSGSESIAECVQYADGTTNWGPVESGVVTLNGTSTTTEIPIQLLDSSFPGMSANCPGAVSSPSDFQLNGIIGVGPLKTDAVTSADYYSCDNSSCSSTVPPEYLPNPISKFGAGNNNGVALTFGPILQSGVYGADGYAIFGVGTAGSNTPAVGANVIRIENGFGFPINATTIFNSVGNYSFLDSGSNFFYFSNAFLNLCPDNSGAFCPLEGYVAETATMVGNNGNGGTTNATINFTIGNAYELFNGVNTAFSTIGYAVGGLGSNVIDWGMPFYYGKTVYTVFSGESATFNGITLPASARGYWIY